MSNNPVLVAGHGENFFCLDLLVCSSVRLLLGGDSDQHAASREILLVALLPDHEPCEWCALHSNVSFRCS